MQVEWLEDVLSAAADDDVEQFKELMSGETTVPVTHSLSALHVASSAGALGVVEWLCTSEDLHIERELVGYAASRAGCRPLP